MKNATAIRTAITRISETDPEYGLAAAVIYQALKDLHDTDEIIALDALMFFLGDQTGYWEKMDLNIDFLFVEVLRMTRTSYQGLSGEVAKALDGLRGKQVTVYRERLREGLKKTIWDAREAAEKVDAGRAKPLDLFPREDE